MKYIKSYSVFEKARNLDHSTDEFGIVLVSPEDMPDELINTHDTAVNYWEDYKEDWGWTEDKKRLIPADETIYSTQGKVDMSIVDEMDDEEYEEGDIVIADYQGKKWIFDGHHRMVRDRKQGKYSMAYVIKKKDIDFINRMIYGEKKSKKKKNKNKD